MSLTLLVVMVVVGIAAVVAAVHMTGGTVTAALDGTEAARQRFASDFADMEVTETWLTEQRDAAFLALEDGRTGIVCAFGDRFLTRIASAGDPAMRVECDGRTVRIRMDDFTWHGGPFTFASEADALAIARRLGAEADTPEGAKTHG
ncbi:hypothetical protein [Mesorhizobium sp. Z1-4]|uniref:hypothetical protein n=1 Tax=Mesorhizobium sp. Z1-4 TaxID=2448478 RepID=UPI00197D4DC7|nr:hypothetical protein [Mesorhizobium sp. Z1-4]